MSEEKEQPKADYERWMRLFPIWPLQMGCELLAGVEPSNAAKDLLDAYGTGKLPEGFKLEAPANAEAKRIWDIAQAHVKIDKLKVSTENLDEGVVHWVFQYHLLSWASIGAPGVSLSPEIKEARDHFAIPDPQSAQLLDAMRSTTDKKQRQARMDRIFSSKPLPPPPSAMAQKANLS